MKKFLLAFIALFFCMTSYVNAGSKIVFTKTASIIRPKSPQPEVPTLILGEYDDEELVIYLSEYDGDITITVTDATTLQLVSIQTESVISPDTVSIDLSNLPCSIYNIMIELDNGDCYSADIQI